MPRCARVVGQRDGGGPAGGDAGAEPGQGDVELGGEGGHGGQGRGDLGLTGAADLLVAAPGPVAAVYRAGQVGHRASSVRVRAAARAWRAIWAPRR